jgi:AMP-binding enzyme
MTDTMQPTELSDAARIAELAAQGMLPALYARLKPDAISVYGAHSKRTFAELNANANRLVAALARAGVGDGDHIALACGNTVEFIEVLAAVWRSGLRLTPINWHLSPPEVAYIVSDCKAKAFICHADFAAAGLASVNDNLKIKLAIGGEIDGFASYEKALAELLGIDVIKGLGLYLANDKTQTDVRCAIAGFQASHGILTARTLVIDTTPVLATGQGSIDLRDETLNLSLMGHPKTFQLIRLAAPITLTGHLKSPKVGVKASGATGQAVVAVALGAFVSPLAALLPFVDPGLAKNADCASLVAEAQAKGAPVRVSATAR